MSRKGPRPHVWKVQGQVNHEQHIAWQRAKAQAKYRDELWMLSFDEFQRLWLPYWHLRGRGVNDYVMSREDPRGAWVIGNVDVIQRIEYLRRQREYKEN